jgi:hypothetical protein
MEAMLDLSLRRTAFAGAVLALAVLPSAALQAQEVQVPLEGQTSVAVTIYNQDLALVRDQRDVPLESGLNHLAFIDVSAYMRPETALITVEGIEAAVLEQNFNFDLLTPQTLLDKSVGQMVRLVRVNPETGEDIVEEGLLLSTAGGITVRIGDRIETAYPGRIVFDQVPVHLRARPTLVIDLEAASSGDASATLSYLTGGLGWKADYVAELSDDESTINLNGWVTLTNSSGTAYRDATLQLVAGDVNVVQEMMFRGQQDMMMSEVSAAVPAMTQEALLDYHLYTLGRPTTLAENQTKQVALLSGSDIPVAKEYRFENIAYAFNYPMGEQERMNATVFVEFENEEAGGLGVPLPGGIVRVYKADSAGRVQFVGEDAIRHTPKGESVRLMLGRAFDVTARPRQTDFDRLSDELYESSFEIVFRNAKPEPVTVRFVEGIDGEWTVLEESHPHTKLDAYRAEWQIEVPAEGEATLTYKVRVEY